MSSGRQQSVIERREQVKAMIIATPQITHQQLAAAFGVSRGTIARDKQAIADQRQAAIAEAHEREKRELLDRRSALAEGLFGIYQHYESVAKDDPNNAKVAISAADRLARLEGYDAAEKHLNLNLGAAEPLIVEEVIAPRPEDRDGHGG